MWGRMTLSFRRADRSFISRWPNPSPVTRKGTLIAYAPFSTRRRENHVTRSLHLIARSFTGDWSSRLAGGSRGHGLRTRPGYRTHGQFRFPVFYRNRTKL